MSETEKPIVIKKIKKRGGHGHHGGAWKIAYADFVTAMMAFFLLMWLINATSKEQKRGIANYFDPTALTSEQGGSNGVMGGDSSEAKDGGFDAVSSNTSLRMGNISAKSNAESEEGTETKGEDSNATRSPAGDSKKISEDTAFAAAAKELEKEHAQEEKKRFEEIKEEILESVQDNPELKKLINNLMIDVNDEGLRIQMIDQHDRPMFPIGSSEMFDYSQKLLKQVAIAINKVPNKISIYGHTDSMAYAGKNGYSNWELSSDRANACRRVIIADGVSEGRISGVIGKEATEPFVKNDPASPKNRRISIVLVRENFNKKGNIPAAPVATKEIPKQ